MNQPDNQRPKEGIPRLPKPIDELSDSEFWALFPEHKPLHGPIIGETALGPLVALPDELILAMEQVANRSMDDR